VATECPLFSNSPKDGLKGAPFKTSLASRSARIALGVLEEVGIDLKLKCEHFEGRRAKRKDLGA
jgi:hypothetical protein